MRIFWLLVLLAACGDNVRGDIAIVAPPAWSYAMGELVGLTPYPGLQLASAPGTGAGFEIDLVDDASLPAEAYRIDADGSVLTVRAHDVLGAQYGASAALESLGFRFRHPFDPLITYQPRLEPIEAFGVVHAPEVRVRGMQLHTLHPIEGYFALWEPGHTDEAHRIIDWLIKNRGNFLQWPALDNILDPAQHADWQAYTRELIDYAHARGIRIGLGMELFGQSNLQLAFDLSDDQTGTVPIADEIAKRLPLITDGLPFDVYALSFGEFFDADPDKFIAAIDEVAKQLHALTPAELHADVHVGATQRVTYMGQDMIYYFLVKYADPSIIPDIHTVMYYDLFEDAGGAYHHTDFSEHRQYLKDRMCAHQPAAYFPEDAYWVAFDDSVPTFLPLYTHSRWLDLDGIAKLGCGPLDEHLIFSSGWEWGYWLNDVVSLRASFERGTDPGALIRTAFAPDLGDDAASLVDELASAEHDALINEHLAGYLASRDAVIDAGRQLGIVSQPDRVTFDDLVAATADARTQFATDVLGPLDTFAATLDTFEQRADALPLVPSRWVSELRDGIAVTRMRAQFIAALYHATIAHLTGGDPSADHARALDLLAQAGARISRRDADLHDTHGRELVDRTPNHTFYQFGYLYMADTLCYWRRELAQVDAILGNTTAPPPACVYQ